VLHCVGQPALKSINQSMAETELKRLLVQAYDRYNQAVKENALSMASYWDGYIGGLRDVYNGVAPVELNTVTRLSAEAPSQAC